MIATAGVQEASNGTSLTNRNQNGSVENKEDVAIDKNRLNPHVIIFFRL